MVMSIDVSIGFLDFSGKGISRFSFLVAIFALFGLVVLPRAVPGISFSLATYYIATQFGVSWFVMALPMGSMEGSSYLINGWLKSVNYVRAVELGIIGLASYSMFVIIGLSVRRRYFRIIKYPKSDSARRIMYVFGLSSLLLSLLILTFCISTGMFSLSGDYLKFRRFSESHETLWSIVVLLISVGSIFGFTGGFKMKMLPYYGLFGLTALIVLGTGNKGEILYPALAISGIAIKLIGKIPTRLILLGIFIVLVLIPSITILRYDGIFKNSSELVFSFADAFIEMGAQLRLSVFVLDIVGVYPYDYLYGYSYINPIFTIADSFLPFIPKLEIPQTYSYFDDFYKFGFSQVAESYANFGVFGVVIFYALLGMITSKWDSIRKDFIKLGLYGVWLSILINMTRNRFSFVLGQSVLVYVVWLVLVFMILVKEHRR